MFIDRIFVKQLWSNILCTRLYCYFWDLFMDFLIEFFGKIRKINIHRYPWKSSSVPQVWEGFREWKWRFSSRRSYWYSCYILRVFCCQDCVCMCPCDAFKNCSQVRVVICMCRSLNDVVDEFGWVPKCGQQFQWWNFVFVYHTYW